MCLYFIGGVIKHAKALNAFTNPTTNSYKRLVPGYRSAGAARLFQRATARPRAASPMARAPRRSASSSASPDAMANPYLCYSALLMAGLDGIQNKIHPGEAMDKNLYDLPPEELCQVPTVCGSASARRWAALDADHAFLLKGDVFTEGPDRRLCRAEVGRTWHRWEHDAQPGRVRHVLQCLIPAISGAQEGVRLGNRAPFLFSASSCRVARSRRRWPRSIDPKASDTRSSGCGPRASPAAAAPPQIIATNIRTLPMIADTSTVNCRASSSKRLHIAHDMALKPASTASNIPYAVTGVTSAATRAASAVTA